MLFTSITFLYVFLPLLIIVYYISRKPFRNFVLLAFSLFFYAWGEPKNILLLIIVVIINYYLGLAINREKFILENFKKAKFYLIVGVCFNITVLGYFKYIGFATENINKLFSTGLTVKKVLLPIGISFYIFQAMSYIIDVYRSDGKVQKSLSNLMLYISLFPQLIAGPIVRYSTVDTQIRTRDENVELFSEGINRFIIGLGKKLLLANNMAIIADKAFNIVSSGSNISVSFAWIGILCYTLQIYFDFSGYSDMAIGLGKMFGFNFLENFNYPYISQSVSEFWRRWHISLGSWFRDYVYIPLGGNRCSSLRNIFNLSVVWFLTGFWHGASWNFILWGGYFGFFIILERYVLKDIIIRVNKYLMMSITFFFIVLGWVLFRAENLRIAKAYYFAMFGLTDSPITDINSAFFFSEYGIIFLIAAVAATPLFKRIIENLKQKNDTYKQWGQIFEFIALTIIMYISTAHLIASDFNPFIYFNF